MRLVIGRHRQNLNDWCVLALANAAAIPNRAATTPASIMPRPMPTSAWAWCWLGMMSMAWVLEAVDRIAKVRPMPMRTNTKASTEAASR